jgi:tetratricopeptide (TPR) repeat protein
MDLARTGTGFIDRLAAFRDLYARWTSGKAVEGGDVERQKARNQALDFVRESKGSLFGWSVLSLVHDRASDVESYRALADVYPTFDRTPGLSYAAAYELAFCVYQTGDGQRAKELFRDLHARTLKQGIVPPVDGRLREAFQGGDGGAMWTKLWQDAAEALIASGDRTAALALAWQCSQVGDQSTADDVFALVMRGVPDQRRLQLTLAAVGYLCQVGQYARADALLQPTLEDNRLSGISSLWRLAFLLAEKQGMTAQAVSRLDRAISMEYEQLAEEINLESVRTEFGNLLSHYQQLADSIASLQSEPPQDIVHRVIRAADRWRSLDPDDTAACHAAARVLNRLGMIDAAWEYATTPFGEKPNDPPAWLSLGKTLRNEGCVDLADRAYQRAFAAEPTNAGILWEHAQMLEQTGKSDAALQCYQQIANGQWESQFEAIQNQARKAVQE